MEQQATGPLVDASAPLRGVVLCCTSIEPDTRTALAKHAEEMGAAHRYDLTSEVTHLITGNYETPKYRYVAKERPDVKILNQEWIEAVRELWINVQPIKLAELEKEHTRPTFATLRICMTGFEDPALRTKIISTVKEQGGEYSGDLTKTITHLIALKPEGNKYKFAKQWGLHLVTQEWLFDSVERGMILEERLYHPEMPAEERGKGAWVRTKATTPLKRDRVVSAADGGPRKIRRTLSTKLQSQNEVVWGDVLGSGASEQPVNGLARHSSVADTNASSTLRTLSNVSAMGATADTANGQRTTQGVFSNCRFYIHGFGAKRAETMRQHLVSHDAQVCATLDLLEMPHSGKSFMVVPHNIPKSRLPLKIPEIVPFVTEWWVERCLEAKACLEPSATKFDKPFSNLKIEGFDGMVVCSTGFSGYQLLHLSKVVNLMGGTYDEFFTKQASVLVCNMQRQIRFEKLERAKEWHVPAVELKWLLDSIQSGKKERYQPHVVRPIKDQASRQEPLARTKSLPNRSSTKESFDGFEVSMNQGPEDELPAPEFKRPAKPIARDTTAFDEDDDGDRETLNDLLRKHKKPQKEPPSTAPTELAPEPAVEDDTPIAAPEDAQQDEPQPVPPVEDCRPPITTPRKSLSKSRITPTKHLADENTSPHKPSPTKRAPSLLDTQETMQTITSLLTKPKTKPLNNSDPNQNPRRILGRAPSNVNHISSGEKLDRSFSRNSSLADEMKLKSTSGLERTNSTGSVIDQLLAQEGEGEAETQGKEFTQTQITYRDEDAEAEKDMVMARMMGRKVERKTMERARTIGSLGGGRGLRATRRSKDGEDTLGSRATGTGR